MDAGTGMSTSLLSWATHGRQHLQVPCAGTCTSTGAKHRLSRVCGLSRVPYSVFEYIKKEHDGEKKGKREEEKGVEGQGERETERLGL